MIETLVRSGLPNISTRVFKPILPKSLCEPTECTIENIGSQLESIIEYIEPTGWTSAPLIESQVSDLLGLHEQSGLTWKQLAILFDITPRTIHYWLDGTKKMSSRHEHVLMQFVKLLSVLDLGPSFKARKFLEDNLLSKRTLLTLFKEGDFGALNDWANKISIDRHQHEPLPVSPDFFKSRLPESPVTLLSGSGSSEQVNSTGKVRAARIASKRKKP